jgi:hypothetical protein
MSLPQRPSPTTSARSEQPDQIAVVDEAQPDELETPVSLNKGDYAFRKHAAFGLK